jgi:peptidoglycan-N-acetylglucosamine deacetylase
VISSRSIVVLVLGLVVALVVVPAIEGSAVTERGALFGATTSQKVVGLTFDDGPDPRWTPRAVDLLRQEKAHATFFFIGSHVVAHPELVTRVLRGGNEIGNHTWSHPHLTTVSAATVEDQLSRTDAAIRRAGAPALRYFRPPYGDGDRTVAMIASKHGYRTVYWGICVEKYADHNPPRQTVQAILKRVHPGMIILAHDGSPPDRSPTFTVLPAVLQGLTKEGYRIDDVTGLLRAAGQQPAQPHRVHPQAKVVHHHASTAHRVSSAHPAPAAHPAGGAHPLSAAVAPQLPTPARAALALGLPSPARAALAPGLPSPARAPLARGLSLSAHAAR